VVVLTVTPLVPLVIPLSLVLLLLA
jgi:hypothetical protein